MQKAIFLLKRSSSLTALHQLGLQSLFPEALSSRSPRESVDGCTLPLLFLGGNRRFSAASSGSHRQTGGKGTSNPSSVSGSSQKQSGEKKVSTPPPMSLNASQRQRVGVDEPIPPQNRRLTTHLITIGACSVAVAALLVFYPIDWRKNFRLGDRGTEQTSETASERVNQQDIEESLVNANRTADLIQEISKDLKPSLAGEEHEHVGKADIGAQRNNSAMELEHDNPTGEDRLSNLSGSVQSDESEDEKHESSSAVTVNGSEKEKAENMAQVGDKILPESAPIHVLFDKEAGVFVTEADGKDMPESTVSSGSAEEEDRAVIEEGWTKDLSAEALQKAAGDENMLDGRISISEAYHLSDGHETSIHRSVNEQIEEVDSTSRSPVHEPNKKLLHVTGRDSNDEASSVNSETVHDAFGLLELLHAAEQRQAELDAHLHQEDTRKMKEVFQQELKDAQAKQLMYAQEADRFAKEATMEKEKAKLRLKFELEKANESHAHELKNKEEEANLKIKELELLAKAQVASAVAEQKAAFLEDMKDMKLQLEALCMAFYTQSEKAGQSHMMHKLAVGTFAMEDAMMTGLPIEKEVALILSLIGGSNSDPLVESAMASLSTETINEGTRTPAQLHQKFETMTGALRELSLIPATGGGLLSHAAAKAVSALKVREEGHYLDGIEAVINQVRRCMADGKLADAADVLEKGVKGSKAEDLAFEWVKHVRSRATMEQTLSLLQAHATAVASSLA